MPKSRLIKNRTSSKVHKLTNSDKLKIHNRYLSEVEKYDKLTLSDLEDIKHKYESKTIQLSGIYKRAFFNTYWDKLYTDMPLEKMQQIKKINGDSEEYTIFSRIYINKMYSLKKEEQLRAA